LSSRAKRGICSPQYQKTRVPHISRFSRCGYGKPVPQTTQPAVILRKRRPSQREGPPTKDLCTPTPQTKIQFLSSRASEGSAVLSIRKPGCPTSRAFRDVRVGSQPHPQPAVILRKRRPSQREGLPTKDLCTPTPQTKSNPCHPEQSEGSAVLSIRKTRVPHISRFSRCACRKSATSSTRRHPEEAQAFATRRPANEGSLHSHPANKNPILVIPSKARDLQPSVSENPGAPHLALFEMWVSGSEKMLRINHVLGGSVIWFLLFGLRSRLQK